MELDEILHLKQRLDGKILRINRTLGIEGALLTPDDPEMSLILFNERYEGRETTEELMNLERQRLEAEYPDLWRSLPALPQRLFSGKAAGDGFMPIVSRRGDVVSAGAGEAALPEQRAGVPGHLQPGLGLLVAVGCGRGWCGHLDSPPVT